MTTTIDKSAVIRLHDYIGQTWYVRAMGRNGSITVTSRSARARRFTDPAARSQAIAIRDSFGAMYRGVSVEAAA